MKKYFIYCILICFLHTACSVSKHKTEQSNRESMGLQIPDTLKTSPSFKLFCGDLSQDSKDISRFESYVPSEKMRKKYRLRNLNGQYIARGFLHVNEAFDKELFFKSGGTITEYTKTITGFSIPVNQLPLLLQSPGITYIELASKVNKINN